MAVHLRRPPQPLPQARLQFRGAPAQPPTAQIQAGAASVQLGQLRAQVTTPGQTRFVQAQGNAANAARQFRVTGMQTIGDQVRVRYMDGNWNVQEAKLSNNQLNQMINKRDTALGLLQTLARNFLGDGRIEQKEGLILQKLIGFVKDLQSQIQSGVQQHLSTLDRPKPKPLDAPKPRPRPFPSAIKDLEIKKYEAPKQESAAPVEQKSLKEIIAERLKALQEKQAAEAAPAEPVATPAEAKPAEEVVAAETKPVETPATPVEATPVEQEVVAAETKPAEEVATPVEAKPAEEVVAAETKPAEEVATPVEAKPAEEAKPAPLGPESGVETLREKLTSLRDEIRTVRQDSHKQIADLRGDLRGLQQELNDARKMGADSEKIAHYEEKIKGLQGQIDEIRDTRKTKIEGLQKQLGEIQGHLKEAIRSEAGEVTTRPAEVLDHAKLRERFGGFQNRLKGLRSRARDAIQKRRDEIGSLREKRSDPGVREKIDTLRQEIKTIRTKAREAIDELRDGLKEIRGQRGAEGVDFRELWQDLQTQFREAVQELGAEIRPADDLVRPRPVEVETPAVEPEVKPAVEAEVKVAVEPPVIQEASPAQEAAGANL